ncbi:hypothetical protein KUV46_07130 [Thalassovita mediterranea]|nr:hypothetical protein KUV46_07130 [Thalassovita mediterranea]
MKIRVMAAAAAFLVLAGCETLYEPVLLERDTIYDADGLYIYSELSESFEGDRFWNFWAINNGSRPLCLGLTLGPNSSTSGHSFDGKHYLPTGQKVGVGYVYAPANFTIDSQAWEPDAYGGC